MNFVGSIYHYFPGYLDHIAPLCSLLDIPIVVTEKKFATLINKYYKNLKVILHEDYLTYCNFLVKNYQIIFSCQLLYTDPVSMSLLQANSNNFIVVWLPHGHSDKGHQSEIFKPLEKEKLTLVYGQKMLDTFKTQNVYDKIKHKLMIGNYRKHYYELHKDFYDQIIKNEIENKLDPNKKTIFYAPTWEDYEQNGSYKDVIDILLDTLPENYNLIIKAHHNTYLKYRAKMIKFHTKYENHPNILFIEDFPSIYPLINFSDIYLGDMSSIGYDFLTQNKPMFFINNNKRDKENDPGLYLYACGTEINPEDYTSIYKIIDENVKTDQRHASTRKKTVEYTFSPTPDFSKLKDNIKNLFLQS